MMTVADLTASVDGVEPSAWVCADGNGPIVRLRKELGANEPFVVLEVAPDRRPEQDALTQLSAYFTLRSEHLAVEQFITWYCGERGIPRPVTP